MSNSLVTPWTIAHQAPLSMGFFFRQEYWSGLPLPSPGDRPNQEIIRIWVFPPLFKKFHKLMAVQPEKKNLFLVYTMQSTAKVLIDIKIHSLILKTIYSFFPNKSMKSESVSLSVLSNFLRPHGL